MSIVKEFTIKTDIHISNSDYEFSVKFKPTDLLKNWKLCSFTADFFSKFQPFNFKKNKKAFNILSTVINEIVENAVKFSSNQQQAIDLTVKVFENLLFIETSNLTSAKNAQKFNKIMTNLEEKDHETLFLEQLEYSAKSNTTDSGIGLLTIIRDLGGKIGASIKPTQDKNQYLVDVNIILNKEEIENL